MNVFCFPTAKKTSDAVRGASGYRRLHLTQLLSSLLSSPPPIFVIVVPRRGHVGALRRQVPLRFFDGARVGMGLRVYGSRVVFFVVAQAIIGP